MTNRYTVIGQPIAHSVSPAIHHLFGELTNRKIEYTRTEATKDNFASTVKRLQDSGAKGCNVTAPFKQLAAAVCDQLNETATLAAAVNTIEMLADGTLIGHNTDGSGLLTDIQDNKGFSLSNKRILLVGAGGAARGTMASFLSAKPASLHVANRTVERAQELVKLFEHLGPTTFSSYDELNDEAAFDIIFNATSMAFDGEAPPLPQRVLNSNPYVYDLSYSASSTPFLEWSKQSGVTQRSDGFGMLVEQAADAFHIWEGIRPTTENVFLVSDQIIHSAS